jgi:hypothetical protein
MLPKNLFNKIRSMIFQYTSSLRSDVAALQTPEYKVYSALVSQSLTAAPQVVTLFKNTLNGTPTWSRLGVGDYDFTLTGEFPDADKVVILTSPGISSPSALNVQFQLLGAGYNNINSLYFATGAMNATGDRDVSDDVLYNFIEIRVYP